ncbi:MAG: two-component sensor histidine kinase, partial [Clostridia bacterium]|nr:two-component sensor histidine kinase [Clostridia bacterium]
EKIFERFYRVSKSRTRETGGSGLGLYIVQRVAVLHNGSVSVESEEGKGAVFSLRIPISASLKRPASDKGDK